MEEAKRSVAEAEAVLAWKPWPVPDLSHYRKMQDAFYEELSRKLNIPNLPRIPKEDDPYFQYVASLLNIPKDFSKVQYISIII